MLNSEKDPVEYSRFLYELTDASEHLNQLISDIEQDPTYSDENFAIDLGHVYAHLNRAWNTRNRGDSNPVEIDKEHRDISKFPSDIQPCG